MKLITNLMAFVGLSVGVVFAQTDWADNVPSNLQFNGSVTASVAIDGIDAGAGDQVGAFVDGEIRGVGNPLFFPPGGYYTFNTMIFSSVSSGETVSFKFLIQQQIRLLILMKHFLLLEI